MANNVQPKFEFLRLSTKPSARISYSFSPAVDPRKAKPVLVVFLNGLGLPQSGWTTAILKLRQLAGVNMPAVLTYDRYGQGRTVDRDPADEGVADPAHGHDCLTAVYDMRQLISQVATDMMGLATVESLQLVLVGNSIGCAIARLYAQEYFGTVSGILFLDSSLTNTDFVSLFPDPDAPFFDASLPPGLSLDDLRSARAKMRSVYHPELPNKEGMSRKNLMQLLPYADSPPLTGPDGRGPLITVVGHDFRAFAEQTRKTLGVAVELIEAYANSYWQEYNEGLTLLTEPGRSSGPFQAPCTGHFVQADNPGFVAERLHEMLQRLD